MAKEPGNANRLLRETSPYLLQHAYNPVDWRAWGDEALSAAKKENKPILLSVGYSSCHWCHVMERESFENPGIARLMNENFICIKVDREERPDIDQIYQNVAQLMTRSGGWPLTVFLTPDLKPFFGGTYFPPEDRHGRPGFPRVLAALAAAFKNDSAAIAENASRLCEAIAQLESIPASRRTIPNKADLKKIVDALLGHVDWRHGGFGGAPKFPSPMGFSFLWRWGALAQMGQAQDAVVLTLDRMARSGTYDQLGGGFHRYSVDEKWSVPHFEKMLYDNALLLKLYSEVLVAPLASEADDEEKALFLEVIQETVDYVLREMTDAATGAFYSAQDADSEGEEGRFFVWNRDEIEDALRSSGGPAGSDEGARADADLACAWFGVTEGGNFEGSGKTVLHQARPEGSLEEKEKIRALKKILFQKRELRAKPFRDEKNLASWNALMISGLSWASLALSERGDADRASRAKEAAARAYGFLLEKLSKNDHLLWSVHKDGISKIDAFLDDYTFSANAAIDLSRVMGAEEGAALWRQARRWVDTIWREFSDGEGGAFFFTSGAHEQLIARPKTLFDQAIPSGSAVALWCSGWIAEYFADAALLAKTQECFSKLFEILAKNPFGMAELASGSLLWVCAPTVVSGSAPGGFAHPFLVFKSESGPPLTACRKQSCAPVETSSRESWGRFLIKNFEDASS